MLTDLAYDKPYDTISIEVPTTDGQLFAIFVENEARQCIRVAIQIGKSGTSIRAWTEAVAELVNLALARDVKLSTLSVLLSGIGTDRSITTKDRTDIRSGPGGLVYAIGRYIRVRNNPQDRLPFIMPWAD